MTEISHQPSALSLQPRGKDRRRRFSRADGFTLIEVLVAILIVAVVSMVLLNRRIEVVKDAAKIRDERVAWLLAAFKMGDLSRDPAAIAPSDSGDFSVDLPDQAAFRWSYEATRETVPLDETPDQKPREVLRVRLKIIDPEDVELQALEAMFSVEPEQTP